MQSLSGIYNIFEAAAEGIQEMKDIRSFIHRLDPQLVIAISGAAFGGGQIEEIHQRGFCRIDHLCQVLSLTAKLILLFFGKHRLFQSFGQLTQVSAA
ncbi:hypothetical protein DSECCO2_418030 [anaerobic digester metagenome]